MMADEKKNDEVKCEVCRETKPPMPTTPRGHFHAWRKRSREDRDVWFCSKECARTYYLALCYCCGDSVRAWGLV